MTGKDYKQFANTILHLVPDIPLSSKEIEALIKTQGLKRFIQNHAAGLAETTELLIRMENQGGHHGE